MTVFHYNELKPSELDELQFMNPGEEPEFEDLTEILARQLRGEYEVRSYVDED